MSESWFYTHGGRQHGPVTAAELDRLAETGGLNADDLLWRAGADRSTAVEAGTAMISLAQTPGYVPAQKPAWPPAPVPPAARSAPSRGGAPPAGAAPRTAGLPDWLSDVGPPPEIPLALPVSAAPAEAVPAEPAAPPPAGTPDWLQDVRLAEEHAPDAHGSGHPIDPPQAPPSTAQPPAAAVDHDAVLMRRQPSAAPARRPAPASRTPPRASEAAPPPAVPKEPPPIPVARPVPRSPQEAFERAKRELSAWVDNDSNQALVSSGDVDVIVSLPEMQVILEPYQSLGGVFVDRLQSHLQFLVDNRRKFYASRGKPPS